MGGLDAIRAVAYSRWDLDAVQHQVGFLRTLLCCWPQLAIGNSA